MSAFQLFRIQQLDSQIDQIKLRLYEIEKILSDQTILQQAQEQERLTNHLLLKAQAELRKIELEVDTQKSKIKENQEALYGGKVKNPRELQNLQEEDKALSRYLGKLEDKSLEQMIAVEEATGVYQIAKDKLTETESQEQTKQKSLKEEQAKKKKELVRLLNERQVACIDVLSDEIEKYEALRKKKKGIAVANVKENTCLACGTTINAALIHTSRSSGHLTFCDVCGRILYVGS